ncbi:SDR family oxidoreductase [Pararhizobium sp. YC-54]|uniref:SDR family oxidoreductase n=1 Tax=Pararhizobium sp. YC-54 TaxID=2986920 RepID=UPI0021F72FF7|nr:SDR family oxidoreductase [Pararhizobium sp. YC-54]MCW0001896.1 SDR family oxidoreductase [Pararhizobium sp. YC-54]
MKISLEGKRVFITGGGAGMGAATAIAMNGIGAKVFTCDVDEKALAELPEGITTFKCDVAKSSELDAIFDEILPEGLDILVNNAGIAGPTKLIEDITDAEWAQCMSICIDSQFYCTRRAVPVFKKQGHGVIINLISAAGIMGYPTRAPYVAAKWAVTGFTKTMAMELGPNNIRVNGIVPGNVSGDRMERVIHAHAANDGIEPEVVRRMYALGTSMQCYVDPSEIADMICFLSSDYAKHVSGQVVGVDGHTETLYLRS